jgi:phosphate transport system protein
MSKHLEIEMSSLKKNILQLTTMVEDVLKKSVAAVKTLDPNVAMDVVKADELIDEKEVEIEEDCLKILALHQPVAVDLRYIVGVMKMNNDLERIGDLAVNIAERSIFLAKSQRIDAPFDFDDMAKKTVNMLQRSIDSLINFDKEVAKDVILKDNEVDEINRQMYKTVFSEIKKSPDNVAELVNYLAISRNLERIADFTTNIAEDVIYMIEGSIVRHSPDIYQEKSE